MGSGQYCNAFFSPEHAHICCTIHKPRKATARHLFDSSASASSWFESSMLISNTCSRNHIVCPASGCSERSRSSTRISKKFSELVVQHSLLCYDATTDAVVTTYPAFKLRHRGFHLLKTAQRTSHSMTPIPIGDSTEEQLSCFGSSETLFAVSLCLVTKILIHMSSLAEQRRERAA